MKIGLIGLGNWGTALAQHCAECGFDVLGVSNNPLVVEGINRQHFNPVCLKEFKLNSRLKATSNIQDVEKSDIIILALPAKALASAMKGFSPCKTSILVSAIKGLEPATLSTPLQYLSNYLSTRPLLAVISGPSFAKDLVQGLPLGLVVAAEELATSELVARALTANRVKCYTSTDPVGVEIGGIAKNVIAIAAGVTDAMGLGESARAGLITRGLAEMTRLAVAYGADARTLAGLSGLGDLVLTASSTSSRNHTVGYRLGKGESLEQILNSLGSTSEGVFTAPILLKLAAEKMVDMPIAKAVSALIAGVVSPQQLIADLVARPIKSELH